MMLLNVMVRLLAAVAITGLWVGPAVCMDNDSQIINSPDTEPAAISASDEMFYENTDQEALSNSVVSSKVLPRSTFDTKELVKIFNIAYTNNESRVLSQPLNYYELPDEESVKRDFRNVKNDNFAAESQGKDFSPAQWDTDITPNAVEYETIADLPDNEKLVDDNDDILSEFMFQVGKITDAMEYTIRVSASTLKNRLETLRSQVFEFGYTMDSDFIIVLIIVGCFCLSILLLVLSRMLLTVPQKRESFDCENGKNSKIIRKVNLTIHLENDNFISYIDVHANEDEVTNENKKSDVLACVYPAPGASINEILQEALKV